MDDSSALGIARTEIEPAYTGEGNGACAHGARFQRYVKISADKALRPFCLAGCANGKHFGMGSGIVEFARAVSGTCKQPAVAYHYGSDRNLSARSRAPRLLEGGIHETRRSLRPLLFQSFCSQR